jgi:hypothetical protein
LITPVRVGEAAIAVVEILRATHAIHRARVQRYAQGLACPREYLRDQIELAIDGCGIDLLIEPIVNVFFDVRGRFAVFLRFLCEYV